MSRHEPPHNSILIADRREKSLMNFFHLFFVIFFFSASSRSARIIISNVNFLFYFHFPGRWMGYVTVNHLRASWKNQQQKLREGLFTLGKHAKEKNKSREKRVLRPEISSPRLETRKWRKKSSSTSFLLVPAGTKVSGKLKKIERVSNARWLLTSGEKYEEAK